MASARRTLGIGPWRNSEESSCCLPMTTCDLVPDGLRVIRTQADRFPSADYLGGRILPDWGQAKPRWIVGEPLPLIDGILVWFDRGVETRPFCGDGATAIRRKLCGKTATCSKKLGGCSRRPRHRRIGAGTGRGNGVLGAGSATLARAVCT